MGEFLEVQAVISDLRKISDVDEVLEVVEVFRTQMSPEKSYNSTHRMTMPQAAGKNPSTVIHKVMSFQEADFEPSSATFSTYELKM